MLRSNSKSLGSHVVSPEEEKERLRWEGFAEEEGFKPRKPRETPRDLPRLTSLYLPRSSNTYSS